VNKILKGFKVELDPNNQQTTLFKMNCGASRWAFNWALAKKKEAFEKKEKILNNIELHRELNKLKGTDKLPWGYEVSKVAFQSGLINCDRAFQNFFVRCKKKVKGKKGFPKFKSKKNEKQSFKLDGSIYTSDKTHIKLPRIGEVKLKESDYIPLDAEIKSVTVSSKAGKWFVSCSIEDAVKVAPVPINEAVGVDLGIKVLATCSDGTIFENPKALKKNLKKLKRKQRQLSKKKKGSKNREKAKKKLAKLHNRIFNIRKDALHKATSSIVQKNNVIVLEDLSVSSMMKNHKLAQSIGDASFYAFRQMTEYKAKWNGRTVIIANRFYPSSKLDHKSGKVNNSLTLADRTIIHDDNTTTDRDMNAAINLKNYYLNNMHDKHTASSAEIKVCGDGSSFCWETGKISPSVKQKSNRKSK
jgi:putative transposase